MALSEFIKREIKPVVAAWESVVQAASCTMSDGQVQWAQRRGKPARMFKPQENGSRYGLTRGTPDVLAPAENWINADKPVRLDRIFQQNRLGTDIRTLNDSTHMMAQRKKANFLACLGMALQRQQESRGWP